MLCNKILIRFTLTYWHLTIGADVVQTYQCGDEPPFSTRGFPKEAACPYVIPDAIQLAKLPQPASIHNFTTLMMPELLQNYVNDWPQFGTELKQPMIVDLPGVTSAHGSAPSAHPKPL
jgi:hypothetical protein